jgi:hypothetical protein
MGPSVRISKSADDVLDNRVAVEVNLPRMGWFDDPEADELARQNAEEPRQTDRRAFT